MKLVDVDDPPFLGPDWVVTRPRLTGICGSDSKQVFMDFGEQAVCADPFAVSFHSVTRHPPPPGGKALVYGAGALGTTATAILRALHPDVEVMVVARFEAQAELARHFGARVVAHEPRLALIEEAAAWSGGVLCGSEGLPMAYPGGIDVVYDTVGRPETFEVGARLLKARGA